MGWNVIDVVTMDTAVFLNVRTQSKILSEHAQPAVKTPETNGLSIAVTGAKSTLQNEY